MKKNIFFLAIISPISIIPMQEQIKTQSCLSKVFNKGAEMVYSLSTFALRDDYLYLASVGSQWRLKTKIMFDEDLRDMDAYYCGFERIINGKSSMVYYTPLHKAIMVGNLNSVTTLYNAGADKNKKIKDSLDTIDEIADESYQLEIISLEYCVPDYKYPHELNEIRVNDNIGLSAVELARKLAHENKDNPEKGLIYALLCDLI